jgi:hypothetical protein
MARMKLTSMHGRGTALALCAGLTLAAAVACKMGLGRPSRETVLPLLQKEADDIKQKGEKGSPGLGIKQTWNIAGIDVQEQPDDNRPWRGTIRFNIVTESKDPDGAVYRDQKEKNFDYAYDVTAKRWMMTVTPTPRKR